MGWVRSRWATIFSSSNPRPIHFEVVRCILSLIIGGGVFDLVPKAVRGRALGKISFISCDPDEETRLYVL
jgi:hypothetical protein